MTLWIQFSWKVYNLGCGPKNKSYLYLILQQNEEIQQKLRQSYFLKGALIVLAGTYRQSLRDQANPSYSNPRNKQILKGLKPDCVTNHTISLLWSFDGDILKQVKDFWPQYIRSPVPTIQTYSDPMNISFRFCLWLQSDTGHSWLN